RQTPLSQPVDPQQKRIGIEETEGQLHAVEARVVDDMDDVTGRIDRGTDEAHLAGRLESVQLVVQVRVPRQPMQLIKVDRIGAEALELRLQRRGHALGLEGVLGRDDPTAATFAQILPYDELRVPVDRRRSRIDEIAAQLLDPCSSPERV